MDILSFLLGVSVVLILMGVMVIFSMYRKITELGKKLTTTINIQDDQFRIIDSNREEIHRRIDKEIDRVDKLTNDLFGLIDSRSDAINARIIAEINRIETNFVLKLTNSNNQTEKLIDSRLDKLENKLKTKSSKQVINE